jgi:hypothetical protein
LDDKVAEGGAEIECLEYRVGVTAGQETVGIVGKMENEGSNEQRTKYFQTSRDQKKKSERARILLELQIEITYIL